MSKIKYCRATSQMLKLKLNLENAIDEASETLSLRQRYPCYITEDQRVLLIDVLKLCYDVFVADRRDECIQLSAELENLPSPKR